MSTAVSSAVERLTELPFAGVFDRTKCTVSSQQISSRHVAVEACCLTMHQHCTEATEPLSSAIEARLGRQRQVVHHISGWTRGVQVKLWDLLRTRAISERLRGVFSRRRYTNPRLPHLSLPISVQWSWVTRLSVNMLYTTRRLYSYYCGVLLVSRPVGLFVIRYIIAMNYVCLCVRQASLWPSGGHSLAMLMCCWWWTGWSDAAALRQS